MPAKAKAHRRGSYQRDAARVRALAYSDPSTRCRRCGLTLADKPGDTWDAGHIHDGVPGSPLAPEHSSCNRSAGATEGNRRRLGLKPTRDW
jgi:hypothetical protein